MRLVQVALLLAVSASPALAQRGPVIVIPGRADVPVIVNGVDVSWAVVEGEFGLDRPGMVAPTVIYQPFLVPMAYGPGYATRGFFPQTGRRPGYGRLEVVPPPDRALPPRAPSFYRKWSNQSAPSDANDYAPPDSSAVFIGAGRNQRDATPKASSDSSPAAVKAGLDGHNATPNAPSDSSPASVRGRRNRHAEGQSAPQGSRHGRR